MTENEKKGRERLENALKRYDMEYYEQFPEAEEEICNSAEFADNMAKLLRRNRAKKLLLSYKTCRRIAACIAACFVTFGSITNVVAYYELQNNSAYENYIYEIPETIEKVYEPIALPQGYEFESQTTEALFSMTVYKNGEEKIMLKQEILYTKTEPKSNYTSISTVNGTVVWVSEQEAYIAYSWDGRKYTFTLAVPKSVDDIDSSTLVFDIMSMEE